MRFESRSRSECFSQVVTHHRNALSKIVGEDAEQGLGMAYQNQTSRSPGTRAGHWHSYLLSSRNTRDWVSDRSAKLVENNQCE